MNPFGMKARLVAASAMAIALAGCDDGRQIDAPQPAPLADLAAISELPYAEPAPVTYYEPERGYQWAERAYGVQRTFYDAPPDYGFEYDGVAPWVWETADDWTMYAEPWDDGYRYYYYEPGGYYPYFVRDRDYGYAFAAGGVLIAVFDSGGRYLPVNVVYRLAPTAGRYYVRGHTLRSVGVKAPRFEVTDRVWAVEAPRVSRGADRWLRAARDDKAWRAWRERDGDRELKRFTQETRRREVQADRWRERVARQPVATIAPQDARRDARRQDPRIEADRAQAETQAQRRELKAARQQAQAEQQRQVQAQRQQAQAEQQRQVQAERQQVRAEQQRQVQAQRQQAQVEQRQVAQAERRQQAEAQRQQAEAARQESQKRAKAAAADESGKPASAKERERGKKD